MKKTIIVFFGIFLIFLGTATISASYETQKNSQSMVSEVQNNIKINENNTQTYLLAQLQNDNDKEHNERREKLHEMIAWRLIKFLDLNEEQSFKFLPIFKESNEKRFQLIDEHRKLVGKIIKDIDDESVPESSLKEQLAKIEQIENEIIKERENYQIKTRKILNERQFIKLRLFEDKLKNDLFQRFRDRPRPEGEQRERERFNPQQ
jgi:hypothetical protein